MGKSQTILSDLKQAKKAKEADKVSVLRMLVAAMKNLEIEKKAKLESEDVLRVIKKEAKKRTEAIEMYKKAGRSELVEKETNELKIIKKYLPAIMGKEELVKIVSQMKEAGELGDDFGSAMKAVMTKVKGKADGGLVASVVKENL